MLYNIYMIDDKIIFKVNENILEPAAESGERIILNSPTARCLQLLLESNKEIVSREQFLEVVWRSRGIVVSENTFYQNISLLRKSLKSAGLTKDIITTVRRKGFRLSSDAAVVVVSDTEVINTDQQVNSDAKMEVVIPEVAGNNQPELAELAVKKKRAVFFGAPVWLVLLIIVLIGLEIASIITRHFI